MSQPYVGEIRLLAFNFAPAGWAFCNGQLLDIASYDTLYNLIGTTYGGDGVNTFALPDLQSRVPIHQGTGPGLSSYTLAQSGGVEAVTLTTGQIPVHTHGPQAGMSAAASTSPSNNVWAAATDTPYSATAPAAPMAPQAVGQAGGSQPHDNMVPFLAVQYAISLFGVFPSAT